jgi:hypothetical protein
MVQQNLAVYDRLVATERAVGRVAVPDIKEIR